MLSRPGVQVSRKTAIAGAVVAGVAVSLFTHW